MCGYFSIGFIDFMLKGQSLLDYTNLFCPYDYEKNDRVVLTEKVQSMSLLQNLIKINS